MVLCRLGRAQRNPPSPPPITPSVQINGGFRRSLYPPYIYCLTIVPCPITDVGDNPVGVIFLLWHLPIAVNHYWLIMSHYYETHLLSCNNITRFTWMQQWSCPTTCIAFGPYLKTTWIFQHAGVKSKVHSVEVFNPTNPSHKAEFTKTNEGFGKDDFGSTWSVMKKICISTLITSISIPWNTATSTAQ